MTLTPEYCLESAGLVDVMELRFKWPMNEWPETRTTSNSVCGCVKPA